jgi:hypothetical protein
MVGLGCEFSWGFCWAVFFFKKSVHDSLADTTRAVELVPFLLGAVARACGFTLDSFQGFMAGSRERGAVCLAFSSTGSFPFMIFMVWFFMDFDSPA